MSAKEWRERQAEIRDVPTIPWLEFDHDEGHHPLTTIQEYPISRKWTREELRELEFGNLQHRSATEALAMIQSWMFFGLLESAFNTPFQTKSFLLPTTNGRRVVHTAYLRKWIDDYHANVNLSPPNHSLQRQAQQDRLVDSLNYSRLLEPKTGRNGKGAPFVTNQFRALWACYTSDHANCRSRLDRGPAISIFRAVFHRL
jgi:hypothetical protein